MIKRSQPRSIPDRYPYFQVGNVATNGLHWMRIPSMTLLNRLTALLKEQDLGADRLQSWWAGAVIGLAWAHETLELETEESEDLQAYGFAVLEELHEAGYRPSDIFEMATIIDMAAGKNAGDFTAAAERARFFGQNGVAMNSSGSVSAQTSTETPADSLSATV